MKVLLVVDVIGRPASYSTASTPAWKSAVRKAISEQAARPYPGRTPEARNADEIWDLDNLIKPTLDAMEGVFGLRGWRGSPQAADDRVDHLDASNGPCDRRASRSPDRSPANLGGQ
jgi:hypothetical protein